MLLFLPERNGYMKEYEVERTMKPLEEMDVIDDFLFTEIMADEKDSKELCKMILSCVLKRKISEIHMTAQKAVPGISESTHGIRMDAFITENKEKSNDSGADINVYDIEPDKKSAKKESLPKRSRYYGDLIDVQLLKTGVDYDKLPELINIFILSYDPFGGNSMYYEAGSIIKTHPQLPYNDGVRRIYLYVDGDLPENADDDDKKLKNLLRYIGHSKKANVTDDITRKLDDIVRETKLKKDVGIRYMKSWEIIKDAKEEGREEGRKEGREEGRKEGREEERMKTEAAEARAAAAEAELARYKEKYEMLLRATGKA